jgi:N-acetylglucosamine-6-phosphate deacetylase
LVSIAGAHRTISSTMTRVALQAIFARRAFTPQHEITDAVVLIDGEKIAAVGRREEVAVPASARRYERRHFSIVPGFIDVHIHGAAGYDVMDSSAEALAAIAAGAATHGTTSLVATTVTASEESTSRAVEAVAAGMEGSTFQRAAGIPSAEVLGVHFEGPFISPARRGVQPEQWIAAPSISLFRRLLTAAKGTARILTLAPELPGTAELITEALRAGVVVSLGHTDASYTEAMAAISLGARHAAHVFNAMRPFAHRETGVLGAILTSPGVTAELIADGVHVDDAAIRVLLAAKGPQSVILVSDGTAATGMPDGKYRLGMLEVNVAGGIVRNSEGKLAGSTLTLDRALRHMVALGLPLCDVLPMLTANPARLLRLEKRKGCLVAGADADLVLLDDQLQVSGVMTRGAGLT